MTADVDMFFPQINVPLFLKPPAGKTDGLAYNPSAQISHSQNPVRNPFNHVKIRSVLSSSVFLQCSTNLIDYCILLH